MFIKSLKVLHLKRFKRVDEFFKFRGGKMKVVGIWEQNRSLLGQNEHTVSHLVFGENM